MYPSTRLSCRLFPCLIGLLILPVTRAADDTVSTAVFSRVSKEYRRERLPDGSPKPEYFALGNGGMVDGTSRDKTVERVTYPAIAALVLPQLARQGYHYAKDAKQASLLVVLHWGNTVPYSDIGFRQGLGPASQAAAQLQQLKNGGAVGGELDGAAAELERTIMLLEMERLMNNMYAAPNARLLGYIEDINDSNDIRRLVGVGADRYNDLMADVQESRYYVIISAYDFREATEQGKQKLLWVTRVSVRTPGNAFDDSVAAMLKGASKYFGQDSGRLIRGEETKGKVELGDLKFLGEAREADLAKEPEANRK
jgi:hypothetical protein